MYYVIETRYVGPDADQHVDDDTIEISTAPAETNMTHEPRTDGWCGITQDRSVYARGEYPTLEAAREAIAERFGETRVLDNPEWYGSESTVEVCKFGRYEPLSRIDTADWAYSGIREDIRADTTDERIAELAELYEAEANNFGASLHPDLQRMMIERRQELRDDAAQEEG